MRRPTTTTEAIDVTAQIFGMPISYVIFAGDMLVMAFMVAVVIWLFVRASDEQIEAAARIPLDDADHRAREGDRHAE